MLSSSSAAPRLPALDVLRGVAVLLVIGRHLEPGRSAALRLWQRGGWVGVDLFFVLSGFLVAGVLFRETRRHGTFSLGRFYLRRGLKIYPAFYVFLLLTLLLPPALGLPQRPGGLGIVWECCFLQSYQPGVWNHTWSLAVEEHFYLLLPLVLLALARRQGGADPFSGIQTLYLLLAGGLLGARCVAAATFAFHPYVHVFPSHLRLDALFLGVAIAYVYHWRPTALERLRPWRGWLFLAGCLLLAPAFVCRVERSPWVYTIGLTLFSLGAAALVVGALLASRSPVQWSPSALLRVVGVHSYSIYLWHMPVIFWGPALLEAILGIRPTGLWGAAFAVAGSVALGIGMAKLIEFPVLRWREKWLPPRVVQHEPRLQSFRLCAKELPRGVTTLQSLEA